MYEKDLLQSVELGTCLEFETPEQAFRHLPNRNHIGKEVLTVSDDVSLTGAMPSASPIALDSDATYLLVGSPKGLGAALATWLAEQGARSLSFLSKSAESDPETKALLEKLEATGCSVNAVVGSVDNRKDVEAAVSSSGKPVKGVFHLVMVSTDATLVEMKRSQWDVAIGSQVRGALNLHHALMDHPVGFFWMVSSLTTVVDHPLKGDFSASSAFLEAFCRYRHSLGLPATMLSICPVDGAGYVLESAFACGDKKWQGLYFVTEQEFLDFVRLNLQHPYYSSDSSSHDNQVERGMASSAALPSPVSPSVSSRRSSLVPAPQETRDQVLLGLHSDLRLNDPSNRTKWRRSHSWESHHEVRPDGEDGSADKPTGEKSALMQFLDSVRHAAAAAGATGGGEVERLLSDPDNVVFLARETGKKICEFVQGPVADAADELDTSLTLPQVGLDSLAAVELRAWFRDALGLIVSVREIMGSGSLMQLGELVASKLAANAVAG